VPLINLTLEHGRTREEARGHLGPSLSGEGRVSRLPAAESIALGQVELPLPALSPGPSRRVTCMATIPVRAETSPAATCMATMLRKSGEDDVNHRRAATYVDKILKGAKPSDLVVQQPTNFGDRHCVWSRPLGHRPRSRRPNRGRSPSVGRGPLEPLQPGDLPRRDRTRRLPNNRRRVTIRGDERCPRVAIGLQRRSRDVAAPPVGGAQLLRPSATQGRRAQQATAYTS
jgi:hypothetical protein